MRIKGTWVSASVSAVAIATYATVELFGPKEWSLFWFMASVIVTAIITIAAFARENHQLQRQLDERELRIGIAKQLARFLNESDETKLQSLDEVRPSEIIDNFTRRVETYILDEPRLGTDYLARFRTGAGIPIIIPKGLSPEHERQWCHLHTKRARLTEFIKELRVTDQ